MKKLILSAFAVACMFAGAANAQLVGTGAHDDFEFYGDPAHNPDGTLGGDHGGLFWFTDGAYPEQYDASRIGGEWVINMNKIYNTEWDEIPELKNKGKHTVVGLAFGDDNGPAEGGNPFYLNLSGNKSMSVDVKATLNEAPGQEGTLPKISIQIEDIAGRKLEIADTTWEGDWSVQRTKLEFATTEAFVNYTFNLTPAVPGISNGLWVADSYPCGSPFTCPILDHNATANFDITKVTKIIFLISGGTDYVGTVTFDNFKLGNAPVEAGLNGRLLGKVTDADNTELVSPTGSYSFGSVLITGTGSEKTFTIHNTGSLDLAISAIEVEGDDAALFTVTDAPTTVAANGTATFKVTFKPTVASPDAYNAVIRIKNNSWDANKGEYVFSLNGTGTEDAFVQIVVAEGTTDLTAGGTLAFAIENAGETASKTVTIKNTGTADLTISDIALSGTDAADFTVSPSSLSTIAPGASATLTIEFSTVATGDKEAILTITSDDDVTPSVAIDLTGKIEATTSISKILAENTVVSPNPFAQDFTVSLGSNISGSVNLTVRNAHGAAVKTLSNVSGSEEISLTGLGAGIYYLEIASEGGVAVKKVVKQ
jgi:hypothetical protein